MRWLTWRQRGGSLDAVMRALWQRYGRTGLGVPEDGIARLASELAGRDLGDFFARHVDGTEDPPLAELLAAAGVTLKLRAARNARDRGGDQGGPAAGSDESAAAARTTFGFELAAGGEARLQHVFSGGPAERAGLAAGDVLVAIDGLRATAAAVETLREQRRAGDTLAIHAFRRDELFTAALTLADAPLDTCWLALDDAAVAEIRARRDAWLGPGA